MERTREDKTAGGNTARRYQHRRRRSFSTVTTSFDRSDSNFHMEVKFFCKAIATRQRIPYGTLDLCCKNCAHKVLRTVFGIKTSCLIVSITRILQLD